MVRVVIFNDSNIGYEGVVNDTKHPERETLPTCHETSIGFVKPWSKT